MSSDEGKSSSVVQNTSIASSPVGPMIISVIKARLSICSYAASLSAGVRLCRSTLYILLTASPPFKEILVIYEYGESTQSWMNYSLHQMASNKPMKSAVLALMKSIGLDITDVIVEIEEKSIPVDETVLPDFLSDEFKKRLIQEKVDSIQARVIKILWRTACSK